MVLLSHFSRVRLCATPKTAAHQAPLSLGFSRQEQWNGLPFPSPMHESEKWEWSHPVVSDPQRPHGLQPTMDLWRLLHPWDFPGRSTGVGCHCLLWGILIIHINLTYIAILLQLIYVWPICFTFAGSILLSALAHKDAISPNMLDMPIRTFQQAIRYVLLAHYD